MNINSFKTTFLIVLTASMSPFSSTAFAQMARGNINGLTQQSRVNFVKSSSGVTARDDGSFVPGSMKKNYIALENDRVGNTANFVSAFATDINASTTNLRSIIEDINEEGNDKYIAANFIVNILENNGTIIQGKSQDFIQWCTEHGRLPEDAATTNILKNLIDKYNEMITVIDGYDAMLKELSVALRPYIAIDPKINEWYESLQECVVVLTKNISNTKAIIKGTSLRFEKFTTKPFWPNTEDELFKVLVEENEDVTVMPIVQSADSAMLQKLSFCSQRHRCSCKMMICLFF